MFVHNVGIELDDNREATVRCHVILAGRNELVPEQGRVLKVTSQWKFIEDDWYVINASWKDPLLQR